MLLHEEGDEVGGDEREGDEDEDRDDDRPERIDLGFLHRNNKMFENKNFIGESKDYLKENLLKILLQNM